ncbi:hypothetical protein L3V83_09860 [Thiotrichales bacterium 19X7-9]|nr:hypothetical protein [Thiotrichales bacterium 19X7-9]
MPKDKPVLIINNGINFNEFDELHYRCDGFSIHIEKDAPNVITVCNLFDNFPTLPDGQINDLKEIKRIAREDSEHEALHLAIHLKMRGQYNFHSHYKFNRNLTLKDFKSLAFYYCEKLGHNSETLTFGHGYADQIPKQGLMSKPQLLFNEKSEQLLSDSDDSSKETILSSSEDNTF